MIEDRQHKAGDRIVAAAIIGAVAWVGAAWVVSAIIDMTCSSRYFDAGHFIDPQATAALVGFGLGLCTSIFFFILNGQGRTDKFDKYITLTLCSVLILWITYVLLDNQTCSPDAWKRYSAYLIVPCLIASMAIVGRRWVVRDE